MIKYKIIALALALLLLSSCANHKENKQKEINTPVDTTSVNRISRNENFYFVGDINDRPGIYKYYLKQKRSSKFWFRAHESVVLLSHSPKGNRIFFLTATDYGKEGILPFIHNVKLYLLSLDSSKVKLIKSIGSGLQVFTAWETDNTFIIILNSFDKSIANYVDQHTLIYSEFGKKLVDKTKAFDIIKEGYPRPPMVKQKIKSPNGEFEINSNDSLKISIYLKNTSNNKKALITAGNQKLNQIDWTPNNEYAIISTLDISPRNNSLYDKQPETSKIFIYSIADKKIAKEWDGGGLKNFILLKNLLIFDNGFGKKSSIKIFNLHTLKMIDSIHIKGGCGITNIPTIPDYSA